jgi:hypothetical protein
MYYPMLRIDWRIKMPCRDSGPGCCQKVKGCNQDHGHRGDCSIPKCDQCANPRNKGIHTCRKKPGKPDTGPSISEAVLLCSACRVLERMDYDFEENPALSIWWDEHKKNDKKRSK